MKQILQSVFFLTILHFELNCQSVSVDSLRFRLSKLETSTEKIKAQLELSRLLSKDDLPSAHIEANKAIQMARQKRDTAHEVLALLLTYEWERKQYN